MVLGGSMHCSVTMWWFLWEKTLSTSGSVWELSKTLWYIVFCWFFKNWDIIDTWHCMSFSCKTWFNIWICCKMITTVSLVNIRRHTWLQFFFLVMETSNNLLTRDVWIHLLLPKRYWLEMFQHSLTKQITSHRH